MKIDESCINHNALRIINEIVSDPYFLCHSDGKEPDEQNFRVALMTIGEISGVLEMAKTMKEVLKA